MQTITLNLIKENFQLRQVIQELEQMRILFEALSETVVIKSTDNQLVNSFYLLQDTFNAKYENIAKMLLNDE